MTEPQVAPPLILVADDLPVNVELLADQLATFNYRVISAFDGPSAVESCFTNRPDICILDVYMPAGDLGVDDRSTGFEVCRRIKRDPRTSRIPVIFVTALNEANDRVKGIEAGGDDFLTKPHNRQILGARVGSLLRLKFATEELEATNRKLRELEKVRDDLMKMIVHDLKTPLTAVLASLEMVIDGDFGALEPQQHQVLSDAELKAKELLDLISDLLELARLEEAEVPLEIGDIDPPDLFRDIQQEWALRFRQEGATLNVDLSADAPRFRGDKGLVRRIIGNLIQNAVTHSPPPVAVRLSARADGEDRILLTVADDGPGIPAEYREVIFRKFERVKHVGIARGGSSGLGLAFCKLAAEAHGGRIWVQSGEGIERGSRFHLLLPLEPSARATMAL
ncbi:MAG: response regulator [Gemmatimonadaceae bacterium]|nr:response regulator [Gemmatimonadaceae bacterium]